MNENRHYSLTKSDPFIGKLIFNKYRIIERIGKGSFGCIYKAIYKKKFYAIKFEEKKEEKYLQTIINEAYCMNNVKGPYVPYVKMYGSTDTHIFLIMELMGKSLEQLFNENQRKFSIRCVCNIGYQMIEILEFIHNKNIIHQDMKPDNFVIGLNDKKKYIYLLDFGLARRYKSPNTNRHYPLKEYEHMVGTSRYASINAMVAYSQSRRDDLEAIGYIFIYFLKGSLPWQGIAAKTKQEKNRKIMDKKKQTSAEELCDYLPRQFADYINYTRKLEYEQDPDYNYLRNLLVSVLNLYGYNFDCYYDWDTDTIIYNRNNFVDKQNINDIGKSDLNNNSNFGKINDTENINTNKSNNNNLNTNTIKKEVNLNYKVPKKNCECCIIY